MFALAALGETNVKGVLAEVNSLLCRTSAPPEPSTRSNSVLHKASRQRQRRIGRVVTWGDDAGGKLEDVREIPRRDVGGFDSSDSKRLIILLLSPSHRKYEFICCEFPLNKMGDEKRAKVTVRDLLEQLPGMASHELLKRQSYVALCRRDNTELINAMPIQNYELGNFEMLWAVPKHHSSKQLAPMVKFVLSNKGLLRLLRYSSVHWEVHKLKVPTRLETTTIMDKLQIKHSKQDEDGDITCPSSSDEEDESQSKLTFPLCPSPRPESFTVAPSLLSMLRGHRPFAMAGQSSLLGSFFGRNRTNISTERRRLLVTLFAGSGLFHRKRLKADKTQSHQTIIGAPGDRSDGVCGASLLPEGQCAI